MLDTPEAHYLLNAFSCRQALMWTLQDVSRRHACAGAFSGIPTGLTALDRVTGGLQRSELTVVAAAHAVGRSTLALGMARATSISARIPTVLVTPRDSVVDIGARLLSAEARVPLNHFHRAEMTDQDHRRVAAVVDAHANAPLTLIDELAVDPGTLAARIRGFSGEQKVGLLVIDDPEVLAQPFGDPSPEATFNLLRELLGIASTLSLAVVVTLRLPVRDRTDPRPVSDDLQAHGPVERLAHTVILVDREDARERLSIRPGEADLMVTKCSSAPTSRLVVAFQGHYSRFVDMAQEV